jgi:hypothetical protein
MIILKRILIEIGCVDVDLVQLAEEMRACEHGNELSGSIKGGKFLG